MQSPFSQYLYIKLPPGLRIDKNENALAAAACGTDGLIVEVHNDPLHALCDGAQSIRPEEYDALCKDVNAIREVAMR